MPQKPWLANDYTIRDRVVLTNPYSILSTLAGGVGLPGATAQMSNRQFRWPLFSNLRRPGNRLTLSTHYLTCTPAERYVQRRDLIQELNPEREIPFRLTVADTIPPNDLITAFGPWDAYLDTTVADPAAAGLWKVRSLDWVDRDTPVATALIGGALHFEDGPNTRQRAQVIELPATNQMANPSVETGTAAFAILAGAAMASVTTDYVKGFRCLEVTPAAADFSGVQQSAVALVAGTAYTFAVYLKGAIGVQYQIDIWDGVVAVGTIVIGTGEWERHETTHTIDGAAAILFGRVMKRGADTTVFYTDGWQMENTGYGSTYLDGSLGPGYAWTGTPHGSTSTRAVTEFNLDSVASELNGLNAVSFRLLLQAPYDATGTWPAVNNYIFAASNAAGTIYYILRYNATNNQWEALIMDGALLTTVVSSVQSFIAGDWVELILDCDFINNVSKIHVNGVVDGSAVMNTNPPTTLTQWNLGSWVTGGSQGNFTIAEYDVYSKILTAGEISRLATQDSGHLRARYLNCITEMTQPLVMSNVPTDRGDVSTLAVDEDVRWRSRDGDFHGIDMTTIVAGADDIVAHITVDSDDYVLPVIALKPTVGRDAQNYNYRIDVSVIWKDVAVSLYPINLKPGWATGPGGGTPCGDAKMQVDGDDLRVFVDGAEVKRWIDGINTADTRVWINMNFQQGVVSALAVASGAPPAAGSWTIWLDDVSDFPNSGLAFIENGGNSEVISWSDRDLVDNTLTGVKRGIKGSTPFNHAPGRAVTWLQHDVVIVYGNNAATAPNADQQNRPIFDTANSTNDLWQYAYFGTDLATYYRPYSWVWESIKEYVVGGVTYPIRYTDNHGTDTPPHWLEIGQHNFDSGSVADVESRSRWKVYHPLGIASIVFSDAEKRSTIGANMEGSVDKSVDGITWTPVYTIQNVAVPGAWENWNGLPRTVLIAENWACVYGTSAGNTHMYLEVSTCDLNIDPATAPDVHDEGEDPNYQIDLFIENPVNGDLIKVYGNLFLNDVVQVDCYNREVILLSTGLRQNSLVTVYSEEFEWFRLMRGLNSITHTFEGVGNLNIQTYWHRRDWE